jgi:predicted DNA-binding transcriptional regulator AlpA
MTTKRIGTAWVAQRAGVSPRTIASYAARGQMPKPSACDCCGHSPTWTWDEITAWLANRPGQGAGGGRPRKETP